MPPKPDAPDQPPDPRLRWRYDREHRKRQAELDAEKRERTLREIAHFNACRRRRAMA